MVFVLYFIYNCKIISTIRKEKAMKRYMSVAIAILLVFSCFVSPDAIAVDGNDFRLSLSCNATDTLVAGETYQLTVTVDSLPDTGSDHVTAIQFAVAYDADIITFPNIGSDTSLMEVEEMTDLVYTDSIVSATAEAGFIQASYMNFTNGSGSNIAVGQKVTYNFKVKEVTSFSVINFEFKPTLINVASGYIVGKDYLFTEGNGVNLEGLVVSAPSFPETVYAPLKDVTPVFVTKATGRMQAEGDDISYMLAYTVDDEYIYAAVYTSYAPIGSSGAGNSGNGIGTNLRAWLHTSDSAVSWTHTIDISYDGDSTPAVSVQSADGYPNCSTVGFEAVASVINGKLFMQTKIPVNACGCNNDYGMYITLSNGVKPGTVNNALCYPKCDSFVSATWDSVHEVKIHHFENGVCENCSETNAKVGDIDGDGVVATSKDAMTLARYIAGWEGYDSLVVYAASDIDGDGNYATALDAMYLERYIAGWVGYETIGG